jgi:hypothetical protein
MSKIGMTPNNTVQAVEVPKSSIEEQLNLLHESLSDLDIEMRNLMENLSDVLYPTVDQSMPDAPETPDMSITAEHIFNAQSRVDSQVRFVNWINNNLNIKG